MRRKTTEPKPSSFTASPAARAPLARGRSREGGIGSGQPLDHATRRTMEARFGHDFGRVRLHADERAAGLARDVGARAFTVGQHVLFGARAYEPGSAAGQRLLAHELTHTLQQRSLQPGQPGPVQLDPAGGEAEADRAASAVAAGRAAGPIGERVSGPTIQRDGPGVQLRSPVVEETLTQVQAVEGGLRGRALTAAEIALAQPVFGLSLDYARVRIIETALAAGTTIGNTIRMEQGFTIQNAQQAETLIHELTHVWQYQHGGTSYISRSLVAQIGATMRGGSRNLAYDYRLVAGDSFFDFEPEQQGLLVENYFAMTRDRNATDNGQSFRSNHMAASGSFTWLSFADRQAEIATDLPLHEPLIAQMQAALPRIELDLLQLRASEVMRAPGDDLFNVPEERQLTPIKPLLELRF